MSGVEYLVTGGAGFIGSHLVRALLADGARVRVIDNYLTGRRENLEDVAGNPSLDIVEGDIRDASTVQQCMSGVRWVLHQAALPSVPNAILIPASLNRARLRAWMPNASCAAGRSC